MNSSNKQIYHPLALKPGYMGRFMSIHQGYDCVYDKESIKPLQDLEKETTIMTTGKESYTPPYIPHPDYAAVNRIINVDRFLQMPKLNMSQVDNSSQQNVQDFYKLTQLHRDQYKDRTGKLYPLNYFRKAESMYQCAPELTRTYMRYPKYYVQQRQPFILTHYLEPRDFPPIKERSLAGRYNKLPDFNYKR